ncbi:hypothetical protein CPHO_09255 [Corynebacterium phocae]|uniref:Uncharacterized protein n=1 Tax=Corynebacterium phocae TaxID=161895 RepID=A0A1L7D4J7_9CORY|nr:hypothetical protein [Corynebacterium phocae]APT93040.1 hypothetical protein CPHO_09255 [Corynebacterium phocae]KAA8722531.1 hypothetical protein F4V58_08745 [Corynebacterium phocae]
MNSGQFNHQAALENFRKRLKDETDETADQAYFADPDYDLPEWVNKDDKSVPHCRWFLTAPRELLGLPDDDVADDSRRALFLIGQNPSKAREWAGVETDPTIDNVRSALGLPAGGRPVHYKDLLSDAGITPSRVTMVNLTPIINPTGKKVKLEDYADRKSLREDNARLVIDLIKATVDASKGERGIDIIPIWGNKGHEYVRDADESNRGLRPETVHMMELLQQLRGDSALDVRYGGFLTAKKAPGHTAYPHNTAWKQGEFSWLQYNDATGKFWPL